MHLINTTTLTLHTFFDKAVPEYVILSHKWDEEEVTFQDFQSGRGAGMPGYVNIQGCCAKAKSGGWGYAWIDSCCIDKRSSAELSEAINSMFKWYERARLCYAYLSDVDEKLNDPTQLERSAWFMRGWTLQELLAPTIVIFVDRHWSDIGSKRSLGDCLSRITGIRDMWDCRSCCIAEKMSWAAHRRTTRIEDEAYSLMGLFDVNMPLLYGEGEKAFQRLQQEILKSSDDESIFAWYSMEENGTILASSPRSFAGSSDIRKVIGNRDFPVGQPMLSTFSIPFPRDYFRSGEQPCLWVYIALLQNLAISDPTVSPAIYLKRTEKLATGEGHQPLAQDWKSVRIWKNKFLGKNLWNTRNACERYAFKSLSDIPQSKIVYIQQTEEDPAVDGIGGWRKSRGKIGDPRDSKIVVNFSSLEHNFQPLRPSSINVEALPHYPNTFNWTISNEKQSLLSLPMVIDLSANHKIRLYHFVNHEQRGTILLMVSLPAEITFGAPQLILLVLNSDRELETHTVANIVREWQVFEGEHEIGYDRVSC
ncbi:hypothetical protein IFR05_009606 [Cadophora sp. M221]|nr:hypothetical protein IFR05_009606 [Cadophora sp. M221]